MNWHYFPSKPFGFNSFRFPPLLLQATSCGAAKVVFNPVSAKLFEDFFLLFFAATQALFNTSFRPAFQSGCKCTTLALFIPNFWESFFESFFQGFFEPRNQFLPSLINSPCFQSGCKSRTYFYSIQALLKKNLKIFLHQSLNSWKLKCGDFYKDYKVKPFLNEAQGGEVKKYGFFPKIDLIQKKRGRKAAPL